MKKLLLVVAVIMIGTNVYAGQIIPKIGFDLTQTAKLDSGNGSQSSEIEGNTGIGAEYLSAINDQFTIGGGFEYQTMAKYTKISSFDVSSMDLQQSYTPIYGTVQYNLANSPSFTPFIKLNLGYGLYNVNSKLKSAAGDPSSGMFYGLGVGAVISKNINVAILMSSYNSKLTQTGSETKVEGSQTVLSIGYAFDIGGK